MDKFQDQVLIRIPVLKHMYNGFMIEKVLIKDVFAKGLFNNWYINPYDIPLTNKPRKLQITDSSKIDNISILIQDIFTGYLHSRKITPHIKDIRALEKLGPYPFAFIHMPDKIDVLGFHLPDEVLRRIIIDMLELPAAEDFSCSPNEYPLLPALNSFSLLFVSRVPMEIPTKLASVGNYLICPFNYEQIKHLQDNKAAIIEKFIKHSDESMTNKKRKWLKDYLQIGNRNNDLPFRKLVNFVINEIARKGIKTTPNKVEQCYLGVAELIFTVFIGIPDGI